MVVVIIALAGALLVVGFDQTLNRRKGAAAEEVYLWLQAAADTAVFQSVVIGVSQNDSQLELLAFYQDRWYPLAEQEPFKINEEIDIQWSQSLIDNHKFHADEFQPDDFASDGETYQSPYLVILPSGNIMPEGKVGLVANDRETNQAIVDNALANNSQLTPKIYDETTALATIDWEAGTGFNLSWSPQ